MAKTKAKPTRPRVAPAGQPAETVKKAAAPVAPVADLEPKGPKTPADWKKEEEEEPNPVSTRGTVNGPLTTIEQEVVGTNYSRSNWDDPAWIVPETGQRITVSYWFPSVRCIIDYPRTHEEAKIKAAAFKLLKVPYVAVLEGEPLDIDEARASLRRQGAKL